MGYGSRSIQLLEEYYEGKMIDIHEKQSALDSVREDIESVPDEDLNILSERIGKLQYLRRLI